MDICGGFAEMVSDKLQKCRNCDGAEWVCENHRDMSWPDRCDCGAGAPCPVCQWEYATAGVIGTALWPSELRAEADRREQAASGAAHPAPAEDVRAAALIKLLRVVFGMADEGCDVPNAAYRWCERINEVFHNPESADQYEDWAADLPSAVLALIHGAKPAQDARSANRVTYDDQGNLDEIVTDAGVHLEDLGGNRWFLGASRSDGTEIRVWFRGKVTMIEDDAKEAKP